MHPGYELHAFSDGVVGVPTRGDEILTAEHAKDLGYDRDAVQHAPARTGSEKGPQVLDYLEGRYGISRGSSGPRPISIA